MKKYIKMCLLLLCVVIIAASIRYNSADYLTSKSWKHYGGYHSSGLLQFEVDNSTKKIKQKDSNDVKFLFCFNKYLVVRDLKNKKLGYYVAKTGFQ